MRTWVIVSGLGVLAVAGGAYYGLSVYPQQRFRAELDRTLAALPPGTTASYRDARYSVLARHSVVTGLAVRLAMQGGADQHLDVTIDTIETAHPNLDFDAAWARAAANPAALNPETALPVAEAIVLNGVRVQAGTLTLTTDSARIVNPRIYPWALLHEGMPGWSEVRKSLDPGSRALGLAALRPIARVEAAVMLGVAYDSYAATTTKVTENVAGSQIAYEVREIATDGFERGVSKGMTIAAVTGHDGNLGLFSVDRATLGATDIREPMRRLIEGEAVSPALLDGARIGRIAYDGVTVQPPGQVSSHIGEFSIGPVTFAQGMPVAGEMGWKDLSVSRAQLVSVPEARDAFEKLGLDTMTMSFALSYDWDLAGRRASLRETTLRVNELGTLTVSGELTEVGANVIGLAQARLAHARLRFDDASLVDRLLRAGAARAGVEAEAYRRQMADMARLQGMVSGQNNPALMKAGQAAADFIAAPHAITVELSPPAPVSLVALRGAAGASPAAMATMLGLAVTANPP